MVGSDLLVHQPVGAKWAEALWTPAAQPVLGWLQRRGLEDSIIREAGLGWASTQEPGWERFAGAISLPYHDGRLREVGVRFRWGDESNRKYDQRSGTPHRLYGIHQIEEPRVWITEGEFDSLILRQLGMPAVGVPGATGWQAHWRWLFRDCVEVFVVFDQDDPGRKGAMEVARSLKDVCSVDVVELPSTVSDVTDLYLERGAEGTRQALT